MALKHKWLEDAQTELNETLVYVSREFGERVAERVYTEVKDCAQRLTRFPDMGIRYKDLFYKGNEVRVFHLRKSSIIYCYDNETLIILSIWNNHRDDSKIEEALEGRE